MVSIQHYTSWYWFQHPVADFRKYSDFSPDRSKPNFTGYLFWLVISVYLLSLLVAHVSDAPRRQLVVTRDSSRYMTKLLRIPPGSLMCSAYSTVTGPRYNVLPERQLIILVGQPGIRTYTCSDPKHYVYESYPLPTELIGRLKFYWTENMTT